MVISDLQKREFPRKLDAFTEGRVFLLDLHPEAPRTAGITGVSIDPPQAMPGVRADVIVDITGVPGLAAG